MVGHVEATRSVGRRPLAVVRGVAGPRSVTSFSLPSSTWGHDRNAKARTLR